MTKTPGWYARVAAKGALGAAPLGALGAAPMGALGVLLSAFAVAIAFWLLPANFRGAGDAADVSPQHTGTDDVQQQQLQPLQQLQQLQQQIATADHERALPPLQAQLLRNAANVLGAQARQIKTLEGRIQVLEAQRGGATTNALANGARPSAAVSAPTTNAAASNSPPDDNAKRQRQLQRLIDAGTSDSDARAMLAFVDELALQEVEARYRAYRTARNPRVQSQGQMREQMQALQRLTDVPAQLRDTFGDDAYDRYLYAIEQPNRVRVATILPGSAAQRAGLQPGDILVSYDGHAVRAADDLLRLAIEGNEGESVEVDATRRGESLRVTVPRGPLGLRGESASINPVR